MTSDVGGGDPAQSTTSIATQGADAIDFFPAALLAHVADSLAGGRSTGHVLRSHAALQYIELRRDTSGVPKVHDEWIDVAMVQSGRGTLLSGGQVEEGYLQAPGEHRGGTIAGGTERAIGAGDLFMIPAGVPHQYRIAPGDSLRYVTVKVRSASASH